MAWFSWRKLSWWVMQCVGVVIKWQKPTRVKGKITYVETKPMEQEKCQMNSKWQKKPSQKSLI